MCASDRFISPKLELDIHSSNLAYLKMCRKVTCDSCSKATWAGCGMHIDSALKGVAEEERCEGWKTGKCPKSAEADSGEAVLCGDVKKNAK